LSVTGAVVVDESELGRLGIRGVGDTAEIMGRRVRVVGLVKGYRSLRGPHIFCSLDSARSLLSFRPGQAAYPLAQTRTAARRAPRSPPPGPPTSSRPARGCTGC